MSLPIKLTYYKPSGKYYASGEIRARKGEEFHDLVKRVQGLSSRRRLPGLVCGHGPYMVHFKYNHVPHIVLAIITAADREQERLEKEALAAVALWEEEEE